MFLKPNATISYQTVESTSSGEDPITGEPIFDQTTLTETMRVSIENDVIEPRIGSLPGVDRVQHFYSGRLCEPTQLPAWYLSNGGGTFDIKFDNGTEGKWYVYPTHTGRFQLESTFGQRIEGVLIT